MASTSLAGACGKSRTFTASPHTLERVDGERTWIRSGLPWQDAIRWSASSRRSGAAPCQHASCVGSRCDLSSDTCRAAGDMTHRDAVDLRLARRGMRTRTRSPMPCASSSRPCANGSVNPGSWPVSATVSTSHPALDVGEGTVGRSPGLSVRLKLTLSYAGFLMLTGFLMLAAAWLAGRPRQSPDFLLRYVPDGVISTLGACVRVPEASPSGARLDGRARACRPGSPSMPASLHPKPSGGSRTTRGERGPDAGPIVASTSNTPAQTLEAVGGTFARGGSSTPHGNLQENTVSDQTYLIRGTLDC
jgi:hypothetical protein